MNDAEIRQIQKLARVRDFIAMRAESFSSSTLGGELSIELVKIVNELTGHAKNQEHGATTSREGAGNKAALRAEVSEDLMAIYRTARTIAFKKPTFDDKFRRPPRNNDQLLLNSARVYAENAVPSVEDFLRYEMPKDFLEQLNNNIALFEKAITQRNQGTSAQVEATAAIDDAIERGMVVVRELDAIIRNKFEDDPSALAAWFSARHTERAPKSAPAAAPTATQDGSTTVSSN